MHTEYTYATYADVKRDKPFRWWYDQIINWRLANPGVPENEAAKHFNVSRGYYSVIVNSDMFKARWEQRRRQYNDEVGQSIQKKLLGALDLGLEVVTEQLQKKRGDIPFDKTTKFVNDTLEKLYGNKSNGTTVNVNVESHVPVTVTARELAEARELLRRSQSARLVDPASALPPPPREEFLDALTPVEEPPKDEAADAA